MENSKLSLSSKAVKWLYFISGTLFPVAALLYLFVQNSGYVFFRDIKIILVVALLITVVIWWGVYWILRSSFSAFIACVVGWTAMLFSNYLAFKVVAPIRGAHTDSLDITMAVLFILTMIITIVTRKKCEKGLLAMFSTFFITFIFIFNFASTVRIITQGASFDEADKYIKHSWVVNDTLSSPNIYWFHCDGMLGFSSMEKYFNDPQTELKEELAQRGFAINETASFEAGHSTTFAVPMLMNPYTYDVFLRDVIGERRGESVQSILNTKRSSILSSARLDNEFVRAFESKRYSTNYVSNFSPYFFPITTNYYSKSGDDLQLVQQADKKAALRFCNSFFRSQFLHDFMPGYLLLKPLFSMAQKLLAPEPDLPSQIIPGNMPTQELSDCLIGKDGISEYGYIPRALNYIMQTTEPRIAVIHVLITHNPFRYNELGERIHQSYNLNIADYPMQHKYAAQVLLNLIDMITKTDPEAVIVLQSDHGLHGNSEKDFISEFGKSCNALELWNNVFSAIRVPKCYSNDDENHVLQNPLNLSRYLINSFVGENYEYLPE